MTTTQCDFRKRCIQIYPLNKKIAETGSHTVVIDMKAGRLTWEVIDVFDFAIPIGSFSLHSKRTAHRKRTGTSCRCSRALAWNEHALQGVGECLSDEFTIASTIPLDEAISPLLTQPQQTRIHPINKKKLTHRTIWTCDGPKVHNHQEHTETNPESDSSIIRSSNHWAGALPAPQGLYDPDQEKDSCGVGFVCHIKGQANHKIVSDARSLLCNMTHRGATGADARDGDGAGVMGRYAVGNVFFRPNPIEALAEHKATFERIALTHKLKVLGWRELPRNNAILGPAALSREPMILQPFVVPESHEADAYFDEKEFERQLYVLRKHASHAITLADWFYICSLSNKVMIYKGQLSPSQVYDYYYDLNHVLFQSHFCLVHSRFSTNTFPSWDRAQPLRWAAHNGEVNTVRGNKNWMRAREGNLSSDKFGDQLESLYPIIEEGGSDSAAFDNVLELLVVNGVMSLPEAIMMLVPEAWQNNSEMDPAKSAFYQWAACVMEPWDGPALFTFSDGRYCGANLDRNGLRPCRWVTTNEDLIICASEVGAITIAPETITRKGRLQPGKMLLVDTQEGRIVDDKELKMTTASKKPFREWINNQMLRLPDILKHNKSISSTMLSDTLDATRISEDPRLLAFGYTLEQLDLLMRPMVSDGKEPLGSMGNDAPLACLATQPRLIYDYFRQLFAQVTNPPIDPIRESIVMSLECYVGPEGNLLALDESQAGKLALPSPILSVQEFRALQELHTFNPAWRSRTIDITFEKASGLAGYVVTLERICQAASEAVRAGCRLLALSDRAVGPDRVSVSALAATGAVHHHLIKSKERSKVALLVETGEAREVHHLCVLLGYGADGICPYLAMEAILKLRREGLVKVDLTDLDLIENYRHATNNGILKVMSKMGISTLQSYKGAQIFEALGLHQTVIERCFVGTASRIQGTTFELLALDTFEYHERGFPSRQVVRPPGLPESGEYHWRDGGEAHINDPVSIANLQDAVRSKSQSAYDIYSQNAQKQVRAVTLRGLLEFDYESAQSIPLEQVEPWHELVKRFCTGAMSYGSISQEAHSALAIAMNRLGGKSNTGEGGEDASRSLIMPNGDTMRSAIKQVASGRFGVTSNYLADSDERAKPGEGGELPGQGIRIDCQDPTLDCRRWINLTTATSRHLFDRRFETIDLRFEVRQSTGSSSVKLVSEVGVGIVASGVAKAKADHILISGHDGGTGASRWTGIKYAGLPWELGLAETHQTLVLNDLRGRVCLQTDGQIRTGRDVAIAALLGAEEFGFATTPLIAMGCIMMRRCHQNTCPVGVATQDPILRAKFTGQPEHVINFFYYVAEELRTHMAKLGFRTLNEMVGRTDLLKVDETLRNPKTVNIDLSAVLKPAWKMRPGAEPAIAQGLPVRIEADVKNTDRALGTSLANRVSKAYGEKGLERDTIHVDLHGSAGQSLGAFLAPGITLELEGDANDYVGKGLSGGRLIVYPLDHPHSKPKKTSSSVTYIAAERFAVRNSGAIAVVEGVGDHGCEYMTGGRVVVLGSTGRNFAAGMSGGIAYVLDMARDFKSKVNTEMVELGTVNDPHEIAELLMPLDYKAVLEAGSKAAMQSDPHKNMPGFDIKGDAFNPTEDKAKINVNNQVEVPPVTLGHSEPPLVDLEDAIGRRGECQEDPIEPQEPHERLGGAVDPIPVVPISNVIPKWNDLVFKGQWLDALNRLLMTNNFPSSPVGSALPLVRVLVSWGSMKPLLESKYRMCYHRQRFRDGWIVPRPPLERTGKTVAIIGSGPAGLACADQLNRAGHSLDKKVVQRRLDLMAAEGVSFVANAHVGVTTDVNDIRANNDALVVSTGATWPRNLKLTEPKSGCEGQRMWIVIGGGDTGNDCIGTSLRHGAKSVTNFELLPQPPQARASDNPWPQWPKVFRVDYGHTEVQNFFGKDPREYCISTKEFVSDGDGKLKGLNTVRVEWTKDSRGAWKMKEIAGSEEFYECELCLLALGFLGPEESMIKALGLKQDPRSNIVTNLADNHRQFQYQTSIDGVFAAGDCRRGQSLVVWGIQEGRAAAVDVDNFLTGKSSSILPSRGSIKHRDFAVDSFEPAFFTFFFML
ncbi:hypothetical protein H4Q26_012496 [Puccinia striiformis f. sp. tritici PST-130]|nr:hypothetical protein H4Q26_012496 [Puccinia striiformis f. sp. tritici PST-130]